MKKLTRRNLLIGASTAGLSAISYGLFVNTSRGNTPTPHQTVWTHAGTAEDAGGGDVAWEGAELGGISTHGSYVGLVDFLDNFELTNKIWARDYGFSIPVDATIAGIETRYDAGSDVDPGHLPERVVREELIVLTKPDGMGVEESPSKTAAHPGNPLWTCAQEDTCENCVKGLIYNGGNGELWFTDRLTPGDVNSDKFGYRIQAENYGRRDRCAWMDVMMIKVHYTTDP